LRRKALQQRNQRQNAEYRKEEEEIAMGGKNAEPIDRLELADQQGRGGDAQRGRTHAERELHLGVHPRQENARGIRHAHLREQRPGCGVE